MDRLGAPGKVDPVLRSLSHPRRRALLLFLDSRNSPVDLQELATHLVADEQLKPLLDVSRSEVESISAELVHRHLPKLETAGLLTWDRQAGAIATADHPALSDPTFRELLDVEAPGWDDVLANLAVERRRIVLALLEDHGGAMARATLARAVRARERATATDDESLAAGDELLSELHHRHLPALQQAGLVSYDDDSGTVAYEGHPGLADEWLDRRGDEPPHTSVTTAQQPEESWTDEGRDNDIGGGQSLFEQTDEELS